MKYKPEIYTENGMYSDREDEIENYKEKLVKCRKPHACVICNKEIPKGEHAVRETGFMDKNPVSCYTCTECIETWLEESGMLDDEDSEV